MTTLSDLYTEYGKIIIDIEILQHRAMALKQAIGQELNKPQLPDKAEVKDGE